MPLVELYQSFSVIIDDRVVKGGSPTLAKSILLEIGGIYDQTFAIDALGIVKIYDAAENEALGGFVFLWLEADFDCWVQFTSDVGVTDAYDIKELAGSGVCGVMGPALVYGSDDSHKLTGSVDLFNGTVSTVGEIWVKNQSSSEGARVRIVVGK